MKAQFIVTIEGNWLDGGRPVTQSDVHNDVRAAIKDQFQYLAKRTSVKRHKPDAAGASKDDFTRGFLCCVGSLITMEGCANTQVEELFRMVGGDATKADEFDLNLFREHGLMPATREPQP